MALISLEHVSKVYPKGTRPALDDINLDIDRGDFVFLVGASGSGKTTLLSLLLREEEATDGEIASPATMRDACPHGRCRIIAGRSALSSRITSCSTTRRYGRTSPSHLK